MENQNPQPPNLAQDSNSLPNSNVPSSSTDSSTQMPPQENGSRFSKKMIILIIVIVLFLISFVAVFANRENVLKLISNPEPTPPAVIEQTTQSPTPNPMDDWKTYENPTHKYSLQIPRKWNVDEESAQNNQNNMIFIYSNDYEAESELLGPPKVTNGISMQIFNSVFGELTGPGSENYTFIKNVSIDGQAGKLWQTNADNTFPGQIGYYVEFPNKLLNENLNINFSSSELRNDMIDQILSTLKFTTPTSTSDVTSTWSTYTNSSFGLSIKHPQDLPLYNENTPSQAGEKGFTIAHFAIPPNEPGIGPFTGVFIRMYNKDTSPAYLITQKNIFESLFNLPIQGTKTIEGYIYKRLPNDPSVPSAYVFETQAAPNYPAEVFLYTKSYILKNNGNLIVSTVVPDPNTQNDKFAPYFQQMIKTLKFTN